MMKGGGFTPQISLLPLELLDWRAVAMGKKKNLSIMHTIPANVPANVPAHGGGVGKECGCLSSFFRSSHRPLSLQVGLLPLLLLLLLVLLVV